jgi:ankyrin repeat protein
MDATRFNEQMSNLNAAFNAGQHDKSLSLARGLIAEVETDSIIQAEQLGWPVFYALKTLHQQEDWQGYAELMTSKAIWLVGIGPRNHAFACSLMMESLYRSEQPEGIPQWGAECCMLRLRDQDYDSLNMAISTARNLLEDSGRPELEVDFLERLIAVAAETEENELAVYAQRWALEVAEANAALLAETRKRCMGRLEDWKALGADTESEVMPFLLEIGGESWFSELLDPKDRKAHELGGKLFAVANGGDRSALMALLDEAKDSNLCDLAGRTALQVVAFAGESALVDALLQRADIDVDRANLQKRTALAQASDQGHTEIVKRLLAAGASPDVPDLNEQTPLILAAWQNHLDTVNALLEAGAALDLLDATGNCALSLAATEDVPEVVRALLKGGADVNAATPLGHTALMKAAMEGQTQVAKVLLEAGADAAMKDQHEMTARDWAEQEGHEETLAVLP